MIGIWTTSLALIFVQQLQGADGTLDQGFTPSPSPHSLYPTENVFLEAQPCELNELFPKIEWLPEVQYHYRIQIQQEAEVESVSLYQITPEGLHLIEDFSFRSNLGPDYTEIRFYDFGYLFLKSSRSDLFVLRIETDRSSYCLYSDPDGGLGVHTGNPLDQLESFDDVRSPDEVEGDRLDEQQIRSNLANARHSLGGCRMSGTVNSTPLSILLFLCVVACMVLRGRRRRD